jgi:hypothetical protein
VDAFKIVDSGAGKTVGFYHTHEAAEAAYLRMRRDHPSESLVLVTVDEKGMPQKMEKAESTATTNAGALIQGLKRVASAPLRRAAG